MIKIAICDDDKIFAKEFEALLMKLAEQEMVTVDIDPFYNGQSLLKGIANKKTIYDIIFLDIEMEKMNGLETANKIREIDETVYLIYVSSHMKYAVEACDAQPFGFLVKPLDLGILSKKFKRVIEKTLAQNNYYHFEYERNAFRLPIKTIVYFESKKRVIYVHTDEGKTYKFYKTLNEVEFELKKTKCDFCRIHQSILVNTRFILKKSSEKIILTNGLDLVISKDRRKNINEWYINSVVEDMV